MFALTNIVLKEPNLALVPSRTRVIRRVTLNKRRVLFLKKALIILLIDSPMLHAMCYIGRLYDAVMIRKKRKALASAHVRFNFREEENKVFPLPQYSFLDLLFEQNGSLLIRMFLQSTNLILLPLSSCPGVKYNVVEFRNVVYCGFEAERIDVIRIQRP